MALLRLLLSLLIVHGVPSYLHHFNRNTELISGSRRIILQEYSKFLLFGIFRNNIIKEKEKEKEEKKKDQAQQTLSPPKSPSASTELQQSPVITGPITIEDIIKVKALDSSCLVKEVSFTKERCSIILAKGIWDYSKQVLIEDAWNSPTSEEIGEIHSQIYKAIEQNPILQPMLEATQFIISSPGIGDRLQSDRDFVSFQGFPVVVSLTSAFKKKTEYTGTLLGRDDAAVIVSLKGRRIDIPRDLVREVSLPTQFEEGEEKDLI